jgi:hypothetical protein
MLVSCEYLCCQLEVSATGRSLVKKSSTDCDVSECCIDTSKRRGLRPTLGCCATGKIYIYIEKERESVTLTCQLT